MNIWIDLGHIPQYNFYKRFIITLINQGHIVYLTVLNRGKLPKIVKYELGDYPNLNIEIIGKHRLNRYSAIIETNFIRIPKLYFFIKNKKIDIAFANHHQTSLVAKLLRFPTYTFADDPQARIYPLLIKYSDKNHSLIYEDINNLTLKNDNILPVLKEWAYLSPKEFVPNVEVLEKYNVEPKKYIFLREVTVGTTNYVGQKAGAILHEVDNINKIHYIEKGEKKTMKVLFSLERKNTAKDYLQDWILLQEPIEDIHSLIYYSAGLVSSGDSMAREAALLGVPSYYLGIRYTMPANAAASKVANLQNQQTMPFDEWIHTIGEDPIVAEQRQNELRKQIDDKFIDINKFMMDLVLDVERKKQNI